MTEAPNNLSIDSPAPQRAPLPNTPDRATPTQSNDQTASQANRLTPTSPARRSGPDTLAVEKSPSVTSDASSPRSSNTSASVSFTLAPASSTLSLASLSPFSASKMQRSLSSATITRAPSAAAAPTSPSKSSTISSHLSSPPMSPNSVAATHRDTHQDIGDGTETESADPQSKIAETSHQLQSLTLQKPSEAKDVLEPGQITETSSSVPVPAITSAQPSVNGESTPPNQTYNTLPDIEIPPSSDPQNQRSGPLQVDAIDLTSLRASQSSQSIASDSSTSGPKTPNVYINGLPPHFPEDQLFELTAPFGQIRSVRSFTRHVGDRESGYGFVLFETIDSAEKCIQNLRQFRNLHPTFSKQVHKIPGTTYAQVQDASEHGDDFATAEWSSNSPTDDASFKARMERLHDPTSTNLYIEGLPLSIDESSLSALVSPHRIKSSRFFQTRLSNPPRIIAFVRLETRTGAEEVIERLHGRMVRGWNDAGSRVSVRFADTSEQRELRRNERVTRDGDNSPARLTIAQAALLNLHGREQGRPMPGSGSLSNLPSVGRLSNSGLPSHSSYPNLTSNYRDSAINLSALGADTYNPLATHDASFRNRLSPLPPITIPSPTSSESTQDLQALLDTLRRNGIPINGNDLGGQGQDQLLGLGYGGSNGVAQARNGYTPTEEYILQSHGVGGGGVQQRRRPNRLDIAQAQAHAQAQTRENDDADLQMGVRGYRTQASTLPFSNSMSPVHENEFHSASAAGLGQGRRMGANLANARNVREREPSHPQQQQPSNTSPFVRQTSQMLSNHFNQQQQQNQQAHMRSSTLPHQSTQSSNGFAPQHSRHYQHNSMSIPKTRNISTDMTSSSAQNKHRSSNSITSNTSQNNSNKNANRNDKHMYEDITNGGNTYPGDNAGAIRQHAITGKQNGEKVFDSRQHSTLTTAYPPEIENYDVSQPSPPLVSPALTYSSRGSGPSLSPTTPFIGSFPQGHGGEGIQAQSN